MRTGGVFTADCRLPTACYRLPTAHCPLSTVYCPLPTAYEFGRLPRHIRNLFRCQILMDRQLQNVRAEETGICAHFVPGLHALVPELERVDPTLLQCARGSLFVGDHDREKQRAD